MKKSKKDQKKIVSFYIKKYQEYSAMGDEDLVLEQDKKMSSTQSLALRDVCQNRMKKAIMDAREIQEIVKEQDSSVMANEETIDVIHEEIRQEEASKDETEA